MDVASSANNAWSKSGDAAVRDGDIAHYKSRIFLADITLQTLLSYNSKLSSIKDNYKQFKKDIDETINDDERLSIEGRDRGPIENKVAAVTKQAFILTKRVDQEFIGLYG